MKILRFTIALICASIASAQTALQKVNGTNVLTTLSSPIVVGNGQSVTIASGGNLTGSAGSNVTLSSPTFITPLLGTPSSGNLSNTTGYALGNLNGAGVGVLTALGINIGTAGSFVANGGALGTPSSGTVTNLTGTASININGTVGATTPATGSFTSLTDSGLTSGRVPFVSTAGLLADASTMTFASGTLTLGTGLATGMATLSQNNITTTSTDAEVFQNTTASTSSVTVQYSPRLHFVGHAWNTTATAADNYLELIEELRPASAATPTAALAWAFRRSTAGTGSFVDFGSMAPNSTGGGILLTAIGTNQSIAFVPSGTGVVLVPSRINVTGDNRIVFANDGGVTRGIQFTNTAQNTEYGGLAASTSNMQLDTTTSTVLSINSTPKVKLAASGKLLIDGLTVDGVGSLQLPATTTTAGGITIGIAAHIYPQVSGGAGLNVSGTGTNDSAPAGYIGEYVESLVAVGSAVSLSSNTATNITTISLTAGDWDVDGNMNFALTGATTTSFKGGISSTSATLPTDGSEVYSAVVTTVLTDTETLTNPRKRFSLSGTTTIYLIAQSTFSVGTEAVFGKITARRVR